MLRPIYYLLILPLILFSCIHSKSNPDTSKTTIESADIGPVKKEERLYFFDSKSHDRLIFPDTGRIFQFVLSSDGNTI